MLRDVPVIDAVVHGLNLDPSNLLNMAPGRIHEQTHLARTPRQPEYQRYIIERDRYEQTHSARELLSVCFAESATDIAVYHAVRRTGSINKGEWSPWDLGLHLRQLAGDARVRIMAGLTDPFDTVRSIDELDEMIELHGICGATLHSWDFDARQGRVREFRFNDEDLAFPMIEHLRSRGVRAIACHKAIGSTTTAFGVADLDDASRAFPDMDFEIIAGSVAMEDAFVLRRGGNVYVNLEGTTSLLGVAPRRFAEDLGRLLTDGCDGAGAEDRILWATGAMAVHPQPLLELFWKFQMPEDLIEERGYPEVTDDIKRKILGGNYARKNAFDLDDAVAAIPNDSMRQAQNAGDYAEPWSKVPQPDDDSVPPRRQAEVARHEIGLDVRSIR